MEIEKMQRVHMVGIGGIGMSALARLFLCEGKKVSGSDRAVSNITCGLEALGVTFTDSQTADNITDDIELVVYTEAMPKDHLELEAARGKGIPLLTYFEALGLIANRYYLIAVAGTHGKTTTTAMLIDVLEEAGLDPTGVVGSLRLSADAQAGSKTGSNFRPGKSKYAIVEACEYRRNFLSLVPDVLVITNIEAEHIDYFKTLEEVEHAFGEFVSQVREDGVIVCNPGNQSVKRAVQNAKVEVLDYTKRIDPRVQLKVPGTHNFQNAAAALTVAEHLGIEKTVAQKALEEFSGTWRRFEYKGEMKSGAKVYDDYAHHPTEVTAALNAAKELYPGKKIVVVFQPHLYSRTAELLEGFVSALSHADRVIVTEVYDARATYKTDVNGETLVRALAGHGNTEYIESFEDIATHLKKETSEEDVVVVMGAGDITTLATTLADAGTIT